MFTVPKAPSCTRSLTALCLPRHSSRALTKNLHTSSTTYTLRAFTQTHGNKNHTTTTNNTTQHRRHFSTTPTTRLKEFFPAPDAPNIKTTKAAWAHPIYTEEEVNRIVIAHRQAKTWSDWTAMGMVRMLRWGLDLATGYRHDKKVAAGKRAPGDAHQGFAMSERKYMIRNVFLESVAGVPGMVAGMLRHLRSMRRMKRDNGW